MTLTSDPGASRRAAVADGGGSRGGGRNQRPAPTPAAPMPEIDFDVEAFLRGDATPEERDMLESILSGVPRPPPATPVPGATVQSQRVAPPTAATLRRRRRMAEVVRRVPAIRPETLPPGVSVRQAQQLLCTYLLCQVRGQYGNLSLHQHAASGDVQSLRRFASIMVAFKHCTGVNTKNWLGETPLHLAASAAAVRLLLGFGARLDERDMQGNTPIHLAARHHRVDALDALLEQLSDIHLLDSKNLEGYTALHLAVIHQPTERRDRRVLQLLLEARADVNVTDDTGGRSPLFHAVLRGDELTVRELVQANAAVNTPDYSDTTPLQAAEDLMPSTQNNHICSILLENGGFKLPPADRVSQPCTNGTGAGGRPAPGTGRRQAKRRRAN